MTRICALAVTLAAVSLVSVLPMGCSSSGNPITPSGPDVASLLVGDWTLESLAGQALGEVTGAETPTMSVGEDGRLGGSSGLNRYSTSLDLDALSRGEFAIGPAAATKMAGPPEAMALEQRFLAMLSEARSLDTGALADGVVRLLGENGQELLRFVRA